MAERFSADPDAARQVAGELARIRADLASLGDALAGSSGATGSATVRDALHDFHADSSDSRKHMTELLDRAGGLLGGLADGTDATDRALADTFGGAR